jgi:chromosome partitioning protein
MIITVASYKGGVGKTTTAIHLAAYLSKRGSTVLVDGDPNRSATAWQRAGAPDEDRILPFKLVDEREAVMVAREFENIVIDTQARPNAEDLLSLVNGCHLLVLPTTPEPLALDALSQTITALSQLKAQKRYRVLITMARHRPNRDGEQVQTELRSNSVPVFTRIVHNWASFPKATLAGVPVYKVEEPNAHKAWAEYEAIGEEMVNGL